MAGQVFQDRVVAELRTLVSSLLGEPVEAAPATLDGRVCYVEIAGAEGPVATVAFDEAGLIALAPSLGDAAAPDATATARQLMSKVLAAIAGEPGDVLTIAAVRAGEWSAPRSAVVHALSAASKAAPLCVAVSIAEAQAGAEDHVNEPTPQERLDVLLDIDLPLVVRFGVTDMPLKSLARLGPGSLIDLGRSPEDPVDVLVGNRIVARGEVVVVSGSYGIRILDIVSQRERVHGLGA